LAARLNCGLLAFLTQASLLTQLIRDYVNIEV